MLLLLLLLSLSGCSVIAPTNNLYLLATPAPAEHPLLAGVPAVQLQGLSYTIDIYTASGVTRELPFASGRYWNITSGSVLLLYPWLAIPPLGLRRLKPLGAWLIDEKKTKIVFSWANGSLAQLLSQAIVAGVPLQRFNLWRLQGFFAGQSPWLYDLEHLEDKFSRQQLKQSDFYRQPLFPLANYRAADWRSDLQHPLPADSAGMLQLPPGLHLLYRPASGEGLLVKIAASGDWISWPTAPGKMP